MPIDIEGLKQAITIADVLDEFHIEYKNGRARCPIHGGDNPTAFSFNMEGFCCFNCGAKGDVIALAQELGKTDFLGGCEIICRIKGIPFDRGNKENPVPITRREKTQRELEIEEQLNTLEWLTRTGKEDQRYWLWQLRKTWRQGKDGSIAIVKFYTEEVKIDWILEEIGNELLCWQRLIKAKKNELRETRRAAS